MAPTRELAMQVMKNLRAFLGECKGIKSALLIGGEPIFKQLRQLKAKPRLIVGTPGRIQDHLQRRSLNLSRTSFLVLDETDRMLDMGFSVQIEKVLEHLPEERQTLLFSATLPKSILSIAQNYLSEPERISVGRESAPAANIDHRVVFLKEGEKYDKLQSELEQREGSILVFVKTKFGTEKMAGQLRKLGHRAEAIHGDLRQKRRENVIAGFRRKKHRILVATDVAARGLDIPHIEHVINYDLPQCPEDYIHRIGRTARAGAEGAALCFVSGSEKGKWRAIERLIDPKAASKEKPEFNRRRQTKRFASRKANWRKGRRPQKTR